ncbi:MAG: ISNCY family transposase, partial [Gemmatimonadales bacterium]
MSAKDQRKAEVLARLDAGGLSVAEAAELLRMSARQVRRLRARFTQEGLGAAVHRNQGRCPVNRTDPHLVEQIRALASREGNYHDANVCHLRDLLADHEQIVIGRSTLDRLLKQAGLRASKRDQPAVKRRRRERKSAAGMLVQIDGSAHDWLEGRGPRMTLLGAIDDATSQVLYLHFQPTEDQAGYLRLVRTIAQEYGLPLAYYHDRHTILRSPKEPTLDDELAGTAPMSQVQRVLAELGIASIAARSPQAKGRIERLWGTLQDRLIKELRLANVATLTDANAFLTDFRGRYNARFSQDPADPQAAWTPLPPDCDLADAFAVHESRQVGADHCLRWQGQL